MPRLIFLYISILGLLASSCTGSKQLSGGRRPNSIEKTFLNNPVFQSGFSGFVLTDAQTGKQLAAVNADHYFTPASNTKILTLATCLEVLGDSIPRFRYEYGGPDSSEPLGLWVITGTGDPTNSHPDFEAWQPDFKKLLSSYAPAFVLHLPGADKITPFMPGWMWDDFPFAYSCEISDFPVGGNKFQLIWNGNAWETRPIFFQKWVVVDENAREPARKNPFGPEIYVQENPALPAGFTLNLPVHNLTNVLPQIEPQWDLYGDPKDPQFTRTPIKRFYACPTDTAYRRMMYQSDNFMAEQLLLLCSGEKFDTLHQDKLMRWMIDSVWTGFPTPPRWVDGSGLSRYNLFTPRFLADVLQQLYLDQGRERLFDLFPAGGADGTLQGWYAGPEGEPFVFAKSGSMSGVYCLSGFLVSKKGRVLAFSCMNNHFIGNNRPYREAIQALLLEIYNNY